MTLRGILPVLATPFDPSGEIVEQDVRRLVNAMIEVGVHGLAAVGEASESSKMTRDERCRLAEIVFDEARGRVPIIVGVSAPNARESAILAEHAGALGAAAVFLLPPTSASYPDTFAAMRRVADAGSAPVMLQDLYYPMTVETIARLVREEPRIAYVKEEILLPGIATLKMSQIHAATAGKLAMLGGRGGQALISELRRGAVASMPACLGASGLVKAYNAYAAGAFDQADREFSRVAPILLWRAQYGQLIVKAYLKEIGVFSHAAVREPSEAAPDAIDIGEVMKAVAFAEA
ncbi:MAG: dihydrodipicolinate synthase family protein [Chloroflexota bacterium]